MEGYYKNGEVYYRNVEVYQVKVEIAIPLMSEPHSIIAHLKVGDLIIINDGEVWYKMPKEFKEALNDDVQKFTATRLNVNEQFIKYNKNIFTELI